MGLVFGQTQAVSAVRIDVEFEPLPIRHVPLMECDVVGMEALRRLAASHLGYVERR